MRPIPGPCFCSEAVRLAFPEPLPAGTHCSGSLASWRASKSISSVAAGGEARKSSRALPLPRLSRNVICQSSVVNTPFCPDTARLTSDRRRGLMCTASADAIRFRDACAMGGSPSAAGCQSSLASSRSSPVIDISRPPSGALQWISPLRICRSSGANRPPRSESLGRPRFARVSRVSCVRCRTGASSCNVSGTRRPVVRGHQPIERLIASSSPTGSPPDSGAGPIRTSVARMVGEGQNRSETSPPTWTGMPSWLLACRVTHSLRSSAGQNSTMAITRKPRPR